MDEVTRLKLASEDLSGSKSKGAIEITGDNLEDLLAYDDLFLDYFNSFLTLPVFPQAVMYNRLTGAFDKVESQHHELTSALSSNSPLLQYGPTDAERDSMLEWARKERLPLFLRTQLFRELKIVKLLLRPLDNRSASRNSSRNLRGYSRGTESYISSLSVSGENSGHDVCDEDIWGEPHYSALYRYQRPGSRALSLPTMTLFASAHTLCEKSWSKPPSASISHKSEEDVLIPFSESHENAAHLNHTARNKESSWMKTLGTRSELRTSNGAERNNASKDSTGSPKKSSSRSRAATSSTENAFLRGARVLSAPVNFEEFLKIPRFNISDLEAIFGGPNFIQFNKEGINEEQTEADIRNLEGRLKMSFQQVKERILGTQRGFERFGKFLKGTTGEHLLAFWLECENFKDCLEDFDDSEVMEIRHVFFRNIQDKFKLKLTADAVEQISRAANNIGLSYNIFLRTQYDVLRRLRAYWVPRFLIHCEMTKNVRLDEDEEYKSSSYFPNLSPGSHTLVSTAMKPSGKNHLPFFPSISLVHSLPALPEDIKDYARKLLINIGDHNNLQRNCGHQQSASLTSIKQTCTKSPSKERFLLAISSDKLAGGPFRRYLTSHNNPQLLNCLLFWEDVTEYGAEEDYLSDRLLKLCHAWNIYKKYLSDDSPHKIELPEKEQNQLLTSLKTTRDYIESSIFESAKIHAMEKLEDSWIRYLKEDLKTFLDCRVRFEDESPPSTADVIEVTLTEHDVVIKRPMPWVKRIPGSTATERGKRLNRALVIAGETDNDETKAQKQFEATSRKKEMERERKRIIKAAYARQREMKLKRPSLGSEDDRLDELPARSKVPRAVKLPTYQNLTGNKQLMSMFRKFVNEDENDNKDIFNKVQLHADIETYFSVKDAKVKKAKATAITKLYLDSQSKRSVQLNNENLAILVADEKDQPKSELLQEVQSSILPEIEEVFQNFVLRKADDLNVNPKDLVTMSQNELSKCVENELAMILALNKRKSRGKSIQLDISGMSKNDMITQLNQAQDISSAVDSHRPPSVHSYRGSALNVRRVDRRKQRHSVTSTMSASTGTGSHTSSTSTSEPKTTGRAQATREDRSEFLAALNQCAMGHLTMPMLYFYKYLLKHGEADGMPQIDKNLFFYIEVQKFKDGSHNFADEEILKRKLQSIVECFLDSAYLPTLQIDIPAEMHQKIMKAAQRYLNGKDVNPSLFDDAQLHVFRELLFYWAGFQKSLSANEDMNKRPVNKHDKMMQRRLERIQNYQAPSSDFVLPSIPEGSVPFFSFSLSEGLKFKDLHDSFAETPVSDQVLRPQQSRKNTVLESDGQAKQSREPSRRESLVAR